ncbi:ABC transporter substrate-binding protein [Actinophytocola xinjiangensis]|uniref:ABC transporter substrate-binding protein n=1 Tax=Actinophytocola xinjiangensis TaxID=485602 RepID=A0A7Z0WJI9_9PSEU|nr:ABC transporter substrate-binding protein [Actinophytocola xinjiangensis]OLF08782.1 ABC transporter substrate-binding protein [Actinophytocola xinjiangensis]
MRRLLGLAAVLAVAGCGGVTSTAATTAPAALTLSGPATAKVAGQDVTPVGKVEPRLPVTVRSFDGEQVTVTDVDRIVAVDLYGTLGEVVFTLGLGDNVVGRDSSTGFPSAAHVPVVTAGGHDLNAEAILDLDPTVVLTDTSIGPPEVPQQLRAAGVPVVFFDPTRTLEGVPDQIRAVARTLGVEEAGEALVARVDGEIASARELAPTGEDAPRITFLYVRGSAGVYLMAGPGSGADSMIASVGGVDVGTDIGLDKPFVPITSEALLTAQPEVVIVLTKGLESVGGVDGLLKIPGLAQTPAGQHRRIVDVDDTDLLSFGPRVGQTITALATVLYQS